MPPHPTGPARRFAATAALLGAALALAACSGAPPSWDRLLTTKITDQFPDFRVAVAENGKLRVDRPGRAARTVEVAPIALLCQRGPRECDYAVDQMLLELRAP